MSESVDAPQAGRLRRALGDFSVSGAYEAIAVVGSLVTFTLIQQSTSVAQYGQLTSVIGITAMMALTSSGWIVQWFLESVLRRGRELHSSFRSALSYCGGALVFNVVISTLLARLMLDGLPWWWAPTAATGDAIAAGVAGVIPSALHLSTSFAASARLRYWPLLTKPVAAVALWATGSLTVGNYIAATTITQVVVTGGMLIAVGRMTGLTARFGAMRWAEVREGLPYAFTHLGFSVQEEFDKPLVKRLYEPRSTRPGDSADVQVGVYAAGYKVMQMATLPVKALVGATHHRFLETVERPARSHLQRALRLTGITMAYSALVVPALFLADDLLVWVFGSDFRPSLRVIHVLVGIVVLRGLVWFPFNALMGLGLHRLRMGILATSSIAGVVTNLVLIPRHGWIGAAIATYVSEVIFAGAAWGLLLWAVRQEKRGRVFSPDESLSPQ
ncbi:MAG TPA: lipopolysaccharide biosynthesis protein [Microthrixaceae bacterium]|nr:lipopolysaccharide biosynthesis protein [Microthrixaceae bacterium]HMT25067.1 lipopolysaccharide biosynthesis protein [Microthrixaceae bacterium]HMT60155.1 lipopolysaccharide biosynthesis protein [Microthrixaceae bacterium]